MKSDFFRPDYPAEREKPEKTGSKSALIKLREKRAVSCGYSPF
jgi:hypothetical protein